MAGGGQLPGSRDEHLQRRDLLAAVPVQGRAADDRAAPSLVQYGRASRSDAGRGEHPEGRADPHASVTHAFDENQRYIPLSFHAGAGQLTVQAPSNPNARASGLLHALRPQRQRRPVGRLVRALPGSVRGHPGAVCARRASLRPPAPAARSAGRRRPTTSASRVRRLPLDDLRLHPFAREPVAPARNVRLHRTRPRLGHLLLRRQGRGRGREPSPASNQASATVTSGDTTAPTVSITAPAGGATVSGTVTVTANAADNVGVAGVQFKLDGAKLGPEDTSAPYTMTWDTTSVDNGTHTLTAVARDAAGNTATATAVTVTVSNVAPPPTGLVAAYNFDVGSGTALADRSGLGNNGTISNGKAVYRRTRSRSALVQRHEHLGDGRRLQLTRSHDGHDTRGVGEPEPARDGLENCVVQGTAGRVRLQPVRQPEHHAADRSGLSRRRERDRGRPRSRSMPGRTLPSRSTGRTSGCT